MAQIIARHLSHCCVRESLGQVPRTVVFVPIDFTKEDLRTVLTKAGYRADQKTVYVWEGVSYYLRELDVSATRRFVEPSSWLG